MKSEDYAAILLKIKLSSCSPSKDSEIA